MGIRSALSRRSALISRRLPSSRPAEAGADQRGEVERVQGCAVAQMESELLAAEGEIAGRRSIADHCVHPDPTSSCDGKAISPIFIGPGAPFRNTPSTPKPADPAFELRLNGACEAYAADLRPRVGGGAISASAGIPHSRCSLHAMPIVRGRLPVRMSDARWREPSRRPRSAWVYSPISMR